MPNVFTRGERVTIMLGRYVGRHGSVDSNFFQKTRSRRELTQAD